jgi:heat shock protein HslJ
VARRDGGVVNIGTALIGDRVQLRAGRVVDRRIELDLVQQGPDDAACCPTETVTRVWEMAEDGLQEVELRNKGTLSLATIAGEEWQLKGMSRDETLADDVDVTLMFNNDRISGHAGCNSYFGSVTAGDRPGEITFSKIGSTRMACPPAAMELENRYLQALSSVTGFGFLNGSMALIWQQDGDISMLLFTARAQ